ncbi:MAG: HEAT repeat domain-containing protein [Dehalococcoidaceae bacterium]|nr:HEAT repeat domain-containing protein [Dehalococcoidaceae bacterium]
MTKKRRINRDFVSIPITLDEVLESLAASTDAPPAAHLAELSDLSANSMRLFFKTWAELPDIKRQAIISRLAEMAEDHVELDFDAIFKAGLDDNDAEVRLGSINGLWENQQGWLEEKLVRLIQDDPAEIVRISAAGALERFCLTAELDEADPEHKNRLAEQLLSVFNDTEELVDIRRRALEAAAPLNLPAVHAAINSAYRSSDIDLKLSAVYAMGANCNPSWLPVLLSEMESHDPQLRYEAACACGEMNEEETVPYLVRLTGDEDADVQAGAVAALGKIGGQEARQALLALLDQPNPLLRQAAEEAIRELEIYQDPFSATGFELDHPESK